MSLNIVVGSAFRNSAGAQVASWISQLVEFEDYLHDSVPRATLRAVAAEGDSTDNTRQQLIDTAITHGIDLAIADCSHGGLVYGSVEDPQRMAQLSTVGNAILDSVDGKHDTALLYIESDLIWTPDVAWALVGSAISMCAIVSPMVWAGEHFYDVWGYRGLDGSRFSPFEPYHSEWWVDNGNNGSQYKKVSSVGSCLAIPAPIAADGRARMSTGALVEWCCKIRKLGYSIMVDRTLSIQHPA